MVRRFTHSELPIVAREVLNYLKQPRIIAFNAPMGAGKTTLVHALCDALGVKDPVGSPTFSIINEYASESGPVFHIDCYRLKSEEEAVEAGIEDCLEGNHWCFIEWAEKIPHLLPEKFVTITIRVEDPVTRSLELRDSVSS